MMAKNTVVVHELVRDLADGQQESLTLQPGVNILVGRPNTGKTVWLKMLDYLFGDDKSPEDAFSQTVADKYVSAHMSIGIAGQTYEITRKWHEWGTRTKVLVDQQPLSVADYCTFLMNALGIPLLHYPQGDPYSERSWPALSWRSLMRHVYRRQASWSELASQQPASEQHACIAQFLGIAQHLFSDEYGELVQSKKEVEKLKTIKEQYLEMLHEVSQEIVPHAEIGVALTPDSIKTARDRIAARIKTLESQRDAVLRTLQKKIGPRSQEERDMVDELVDRLTQLQSARILCRTRMSGITKRLSELRDYRGGIVGELNKIGRLQAAGRCLKPLKVTHCPACDQAVQSRDDTNRCYVCGREIPAARVDSKTSEKRIGFEIEQLKGELTEADEVINALDMDLLNKEKELHSIDDQLNDIRAQLGPVRKAVASILPPEITILDTQKGELRERLQQLERINRSLIKRATLNQRITEIQAKIQELEEKKAIQDAQVDLETAADALADAMNTYLKAIEHIRPASWNQACVALRLDKRRFKFRIGDQSPGVLGGTLRLYFFLSYQYALMRLSPEARYHYPGFAVLDYPATMEGISVADKENFTLEPFIELLEKPEMENTQIIAAGSAFENLERVNRIELDHPWTVE